ncbi:MAG: glycosyltransferase family 2 protein [Coprobacillus cateniformis]
MENIKVSVIVPIYNVEAYLPRCIESLINQTLQEIEIILVNDGITRYSAIYH